MTNPSPIRDITNVAVTQRFQAGELANLATLGISVSDTETTGLKRGKHGLTELASIRAEMGQDGNPRLMAFHQHVLPLKPAYRDYLVACEKAKAEGSLPPPYDRARYEYKIEPAAFKVTGTRVVRERLDGPITGLEVKDENSKFTKVKNALPFYEVADAWLDFTKHGEKDVYFNTPFDLPFLAAQLRDIKLDDMLRSEAYRSERVCNDERLSAKAKNLLHETNQPYAALSETTKENLRLALEPLVELPRGYTNSAQFRCLMYGNLVQHGFGARNRLDDAYALLKRKGEDDRGDHSALEDVVMAARVAIAQARNTNKQIHTIAELFGDLLHRVDPKGQVTDGPTRPHPKHKGETVAGDILLKFSAAPETLGADAQAFWKFIVAFEDVPKWSPGAPKHVMDIDKATHRVTINAERADPLSLRFLKKCAYFHQLIKAKNEAEAKGKHTVIQSIQPFDSTGTVMDVVVRKPSGELTAVKAIPYTALRANTAFLEAHPKQTEAYLNLIRHLSACDASMGTIVLKETADGGTRITARGHVRNFGECVLTLSARADVAENIAPLAHELESQLKLGAIPGVAGFQKPNEEDEGDDEINDESKRLSPVNNPVALEKHPDGHTTLALSASVFAAMAMRLKTPPQALYEGKDIKTDHGPITITRDDRDANNPRYRLSGQMDALHDFVDLEHDPESAKAKSGRKPATLIRDASWLLYRLGQLPGTHDVRVECPMVLLDQPDGVDAETLQRLYKLRIPFKAYDRSIKLDLAQLMENAFHWSLSLKRAGDERNAELEKPLHEQIRMPLPFINDLKQALYSGNAKAIEMNEERQYWLLDHGKTIHGRPPHHAILPHAQGVQLAFDDRKQLLIERSDVGRRDISGDTFGHVRTSVRRSADGQAVEIDAPAVIRLLVAQQLHCSLIANAPLILPIAQESHAQQALDDALRYTYWLSKATGSERRTLESMTVDTTKQAVSITLPKFDFLTHPHLADQLQQLHVALSQPDLKQRLRALSEGLPDVRFLSARDADLHALVSALRPQIESLQKTHALLNGLIEEHGVVGANAPRHTLQTALDTLGTLMHEAASLRNAKVASAKPSDEVFAAIADAQEKLSNVLYGIEHLTEDMHTLDNRMVGTTPSSNALLREQGRSMARTVIDEARATLRFDPKVNLTNHLQPYLAQMCELLGIEQGGDAMQKTLFTALRNDLASPTAVPESANAKRALVDGIVSLSMPHWNRADRNRFIELQMGNTSRFAAQEAYVTQHRPDAMPQDEWRSMLGQAKGKTRTFLEKPSEDRYYQAYMKLAIPRPAAGDENEPAKVPDYAAHHQRKALLSAIRAVREETIDLDHALPHAQRALSSLIKVLGQQQCAPLPEMAGVTKAVQEIGTPITPATPVTLGIVADPITQIRTQMEQQKAAIQTRFIGLLARNKITPLTTGDSISLNQADFLKLFHVWQGLEQSGKLNPPLDESPTEQSNTEITIRNQHPLLAAHPNIEKLTINILKGYVKMRVRLPNAMEARKALWDSITETAQSAKLILPEMPTNQAAVHDVYLMPETRVLREIPSTVVRAAGAQIASNPKPRPTRRRQQLVDVLNRLELPSIDFTKEQTR